MEAKDDEGINALMKAAEQGEAERAAAHFHAVIAEPAFAAQPYTFDGADWPAGAIAQQRLQVRAAQHNVCMSVAQDWRRT